MSEDQSLPVLDSAALRALEDDAGEGVSRRFVEEYLLMLPTRAAKILNCLTATDPKLDNEAIVSLRVTSAMVGALRLRRFCYDLERALKRGDSPAAVSVKPLLFANIWLVVDAAAGLRYYPARPLPASAIRRPGPQYENCRRRRAAGPTADPAEGPAAVSSNISI